ncbi:ferredoxin [Methanobrevibacter cuticularis]|uniref:Ferredoxin n=1 Tax=Methanobrevibacter cuticularis TaxID=47311 RepID=A0A166F2Z1_9EURY|nr:4Fe-4S binding protein [Methanobrevibacter cuticularis]KZX17264.1 ferredoxin [Methanobrevibacter cuticularis]
MIVVNQEDCIKCGACEGTCPSAAIELENQKVVYCDICGGEPKCVDICPQDALAVDELLIDEKGNTQARILYNPAKCNECGDCVAVCPPQTLKLDNDQKTMPLQGFCVMCQKCVNICPVGVIGIPGIKEPKTRELDLEGPIFIKDCVGCGTCVPECPVDAITLAETGGVIEIDEDTCIKCGVCSQTCPWDAVFISEIKPEKRSKEIKSFELDAETCIGCNSCVDACPGDFIEESKSDMTVKLPTICAACSLCEKICPVDAISLDIEWGDAKPANEEGVVNNSEKCDFLGACASVCPSEAIRVVRKDGTQMPDDIQTDNDPSFNMCVRCGACAAKCPEGALTLSPMDKVADGEIVQRNRIVFNPSLCNKCGDCIDVCPYDMLKLKEEGNLPLVGFCTLCEQCIEACPKDAMEFK